ncbi:MAG: hypothetical protein JNM68_12470, partial [Dinghuibacter sp.]|nr:hypothetical protein [Dinghuibacter sp.]
MFRSSIAAILLACVFTGCDSSPDEVAAIITTDSVRVNNCIVYNHPAGQRTICLDSVTLDSRCPVGMACIRAGEGVCRFVVKRNGDSATVTLATIPFTLGPGKYPKEAAALDVKIKLVGLTPTPSNIYPPPYTPPYIEYKAFLEIAP